jgi:putative nucleotidyltransferase with HDIG domain
MTPQLFVPCVSVAGLLVIGHCISTLVQQPLELEWLLLAGLTLLTGSFTIKIPSIPARLSVSETFVFASVLLFGTCAGTVTVALEILIAVSVGTSRKVTDPLRVIFNVASASLSIWLASHAFFILAGIPPLAKQEAPLQTLILPLALMAGIYFLLNSGLIALALAIQRRQSPLTIWRTSFLGLAFNYFGGASLAALFVSYTRTIDIFAVGVIVPLLVMSYLTFKYSLGRVEDATKHVEEIKRLYLSTIETLATAIDAKDQVTHGHIRRVQQFALGLANELGVKGQDQLRALEAAALLHDIGKLVIPEHILNKPGKLTHGEFEKMKEHASVGAEILTSINFPYPVVPIVRHHHENWDGTGYPDGLRGTDIPFGARILAVVDCFDALTSDRPYRPRMTDAEAIDILLQRRAVMYDPLVIDAFTHTWRKLAEEIVKPVAELHIHARATKTEAASTAPRLVDEFRRYPLSNPLSIMLASALKETGATLAIMFASDTEQDRLISLATQTPDGPLDELVSMPLGFGVSGWVAVNATAMVNAEPALDFPDMSAAQGLVRSICVPVWVKGQVLGTLSLYSSDRRGFSESDKAFLEKLAAGLDAEVPSRAFNLLLSNRKSLFGAIPTVH